MEKKKRNEIVPHRQISDKRENTNKQFPQTEIGVKEFKTDSSGPKQADEGMRLRAKRKPWLTS